MAKILDNLKLLIYDILTSLHIFLNKNFKRKYYDLIISLGFNCSLAYNINRVHGCLESSLFNWACVGDNEKFLKVLDSTDILFSEGFDYKKDCNMFECTATNIVFHGRSRTKKVKNKDFKIYYENVKNEYLELISRTDHLKENFKKLLNSDNKKLFLMVLNPTQRYTFEERTQFINKTFDILQTKTRNFELVVICTNEIYEGIKNRTNPAVTLRSMNRIAPIGDAVNPNKTDLWNYNLLLKEYCPLKYKKSNKRYKYQ